MAATTEYLVLPRTPKVTPTPTATRVALSSYERSNVRGLHGGLGFIIWLGVYLLGGLVTSSAIREGTALFGIGMASSVLAATIAVVIVARMTKAANVAAREREKAQDERRQIEYANEADARLVAQQAATLTAAVVAIYEQAVAASLQLPQSLESASGWLRRADSEYHDNAFGPFWDCVESAATNLSAFNDGTRVLSQRANAYYSASDSVHASACQACPSS